MAKRRSKPLNLPLKRVYKLVEGESLRFRDKKGRLTKFDARKKLTSEIWFQGKKTGRTLNKISRKEIVPQKFEPRSMKKRLQYVKTRSKGPLQSGPVKNLTIKINANNTIADNIESKADSMLTDIVKNTKERHSTFLDIDFEVFGVHESINTIQKGTNKSVLAMEIARYIIARLYSNKARMSNIKKSDIGDRAKYVRTLTVSFSWQKSKKT